MVSDAFAPSLWATRSHLQIVPFQECSLSLEAQGRAPNRISWLWEHYDNGRQVRLTP